MARIDADSRPDRRRGRPNLPHVGVFVWRLGAYSVTRAPNWAIGDEANHYYSLSTLGLDVALVAKPVPVATQSPDEPNVPAFVRRRAFTANTADYYGVDKSLSLWRDDETDPVPLNQIVCADLTDSGFSTPAPGTVFVDPVLGRVMFADDIAPKSSLLTTYHYAFPADLGGGEYPRATEEIAARYPVGPGQPDTTVAAAIARWQTERTADPSKARAVVEIVDSGTYTETLTLNLAPGDQLTLRAANGAAPVLILLGQPLTVTTTATAQQPATQRPTLTLDGLTLAFGTLKLSGALARAVTLRHTTLVPQQQSHPTVVAPTSAAPAALTDPATGGFQLLDHPQHPNNRPPRRPDDRSLHPRRTPHRHQRHGHPRSAAALSSRTASSSTNRPISTSHWVPRTAHCPT